MEWTREQKRIIDIRNSNILVSAAAGSGKTAVLVERIISLIKDQQEDIDKFLVVTFTNAAAAGMKQKIQKALVEAAKEGDNTKHIRRQLSLLNRAQITTIHSFCLDIVRKNFHMVGLDPSFRIGDTNELNIILQDSVDEVLERLYTKGDERFSILVESFTGNRGDIELNDIVIRIYKFLLSFPDPFKWLENSVNMLNLTEEKFKKSLWYKEILNYIKMEVEGAKEILELSLKICHSPYGPKLYEKTLNEDMIILKELSSLLDKDLISFINGLYELKWPTITRFSSDKNPEVDIEKQKEVKDKLRESYKKIIVSLKELFPYKDLEQYVMDVNFMYETMDELKDIIIELNEVYSSKKIERSIVDFNDLEHYALKILRDDSKGEPSDIGSIYRDKFSYIFIDEYQDSNSLQETIIEQIRRKDNLFMVGDVKQSIYRFRLAEPEIFNYKYMNYTKDSEDLNKNIIHRVVELNKNFRSRKEVLDGTNFIFKNIMSVELGEIDYNDRVALSLGNNQFINDEAIELNIIEKSSNDGELDDIDEELESMKTAEVEALFITKKIRAILGQDTFDSKSENNLKKIDYRDIVILLRSIGDWSNAFEEIFIREGIPFYFDGGGGYYDTIEVQVIVNLLKLIDNIRQDIPLISVMRSSIGNFTIEELIEIRVKYPKDSYIDGCIKYIKKSDNDLSSNDFSEELIKKLDGFINRIYHWTDRNRYTHLNDLIWEILIETNYYNFVGTLPNGKVRQANLRLITDKAYDFEKTSMKGLFKFLRYIEKITADEENKISTAKVLGENHNIVRLMTVHNSKGLEFPVVILCGLNKKINFKDTQAKILMHKQYGITPKYIDIEKRLEKDTLARIAISKKVKLENLSEEMRILYVAMTRAVDRLIMVGTINKIEDSLKNWGQGTSKYFLYRAKSYMDWIGSSLFAGMDLEQMNDTLIKGKCKEWNINRIQAIDLLQDTKEDTDTQFIEKIKKLEEDICEKEYQEVKRRLEYRYPYEQSIKVPTKLTVTDLGNLNTKEFEGIKYKIPDLSEIIEFDREKRRFLIDRKEYKGTEIGTLIHLIMEHMDLRGDLDKDDINQQLNKMLSKRIIKESDIQYIQRNFIERIERFFNSSIGIRMKKSAKVKREVSFVIRKRADEVLDNLNYNDFILIQGIIDCYFEEDDEIVIIDYKTDRVNKDEIEEIKSEYSIQIKSYKEAVEKITKKTVKEAYLYLFSLGIYIPID